MKLIYLSVLSLIFLTRMFATQTHKKLQMFCRITYLTRLAGFTTGLNTNQFWT